MIEIYTRNSPPCIYCERTKGLLNSRGIPFVQHVVGEDISRETLKEQFEQASTFPVIVIDGVFIGGFSELQAHLAREDGMLICG